jgi:Ser/Thr protein kinase RdoA (MazF antagonist)
MIPVLGRWSAFAGGSARPFGTGLINKTFLVEKNGARAIFQKLHPVFAGSVNDDIDAVTRHLEKKGLVTTRVIPADDGALFVADAEGRPWRALTFVDGDSVDRVDTPARAFAGGALVAQFHRAVADLAWDYHHVRAGVHDTKKHLAVLAKAVDEHRGHRLYADVAPLARAILDSRLPDLSSLPLRHTHGDLKISNVLFDASGKGVCLVDLDTVGKMTWPFEMGDALRSWTNPAGEDVADAGVDVAIFQAAVDGYASEARGLVTRDEWAALVDGVHTICTELSARFLADALNESYFGFDDKRYASRGEHNLLRARGQWALARSVDGNRAKLSAIAAAAAR